MESDQILKKKLTSLNIQVALLKSECAVQSRIIQQLKMLHASSSKLKSWYCDAGHYLCKIDHRKYNFANGAQDQDLKFVSFTTTSVPRSLNDEKFAVKMLSKKIDLLQSKYGVISGQHDKIMVASSDTIYIEPKVMKKMNLQKGRYCKVPLIMIRAG